jgi:hypothetical protein
MYKDPLALRREAYLVGSGDLDAVPLQAAFKRLWREVDGMGLMSHYLHKTLRSVGRKYLWSSISFQVVAHPDLWVYEVCLRDTLYITERYSPSPLVGGSLRPRLRASPT